MGKQKDKEVRNKQIRNDKTQREISSKAKDYRRQVDKGKYRETETQKTIKTRNKKTVKGKV